MTALEMREHLVKTAEEALARQNVNASRMDEVAILQTGSNTVVRVRVDWLKEDFIPSHRALETFPSARVALSE